MDSKNEIETAKEILDKIDSLKFVADMNNEILMKVFELVVDPPKIIPIFEDTHLETKQLAQFFHVDKRTVYRWRDEGDLPCSKVGNNVYFEITDLIDFIRKKKTKMSEEFFNTTLLTLQKKVRNDKQRRNTK